jgi:hypothetical protein
MARLARGHLVCGRHRLIHVIRAVVLDVGECIVNESREYGDMGGLARRSAAHVFAGLWSRHRSRAGLQRDIQVFRPGLIRLRPWCGLQMTTASISGAVVLGRSSNRQEYHESQQNCHK